VARTTDGCCDQIRTRRSAPCELISARIASTARDAFTSIAKRNARGNADSASANVGTCSPFASRSSRTAPDVRHRVGPIAPVVRRIVRSCISTG
jgi:hypothetical protein